MHQKVKSFLSYSPYLYIPRLKKTFLHAHSYAFLSTLRNTNIFTLHGRSLLWWKTKEGKNINSLIQIIGSFYSELRALPSLVWGFFCSCSCSFWKQFYQFLHFTVRFQLGSADLPFIHLGYALLKYRSYRVSSLVTFLPPFSTWQKGSWESHGCGLTRNRALQAAVQH